MAGAMKPATTMTATTPPPNKAETDAATSAIYRDKTGTEWRYRGTAGDPAQGSSIPTTGNKSPIMSNDFCIDSKAALYKITP